MRSQDERVTAGQRPRPNYGHPQVEAFRGRRLDHVEFPYVYVDATYLKVRNSVSQVVSMAMVVATGVTTDGNREILGCDIGDSESEGFWQSFLGSLRARGLTGVRLVIADAHAGLGAAADRTIQGAGRQRCRVHFIRNLLALVPRTHQHMAAAVFRTVFAQPDPEAVDAAWDEVAAQLGARFPKVAALMADAKPEVLAFAAFPRAHWQKIWSTNPVGAENCVVAGQAAFRYSLMSPPQRAVLTTWRCLSGWSAASVATGGRWLSERWGRCVL